MNVKVDITSLSYDQGVCKLAFVDEEAENNRLHYGTGGKGTPVIWKTLDEVLKKYKK